MWEWMHRIHGLLLVWSGLDHDCSVNDLIVCLSFIIAQELLKKWKQRKQLKLNVPCPAPLTQQRTSQLWQRPNETENETNHMHEKWFWSHHEARVFLERLVVFFRVPLLCKNWKNQTVRIMGVIEYASCSKRVTYWRASALSLLSCLCVESLPKICHTEAYVRFYPILATSLAYVQSMKHEAFA